MLAVSYASSMRAWLQQRSDINTLSAEIATRNVEVAGLRQAQQRWHDPAYLRTQARLRFGWVMPGETGYRVIDNNGELLVSGSQLADPSVALPKSTQEWWETAWAGVVAAGRDPADVAAAKAREAAQRPTPASQIGGPRHPGAAGGRGDGDFDHRLVPDTGQGGGTVGR